MAIAGFGFSTFGILVVALAALFVVGAIAVVIVLLVTGKKETDTAPVGDSGVMGAQESYFDGGFFGYIGMLILFGLITFFTLGIATPWAICMMRRWEVSHTVVSGRRLKFTGTGGQLFGKYIVGFLLSLITFGIYSIWFGLSIEKWAVSHTVYEDNPNEKASRFTGGAGGWFAYNLLMIVLPFVTLGIGLPFAVVMRAKWLASNTVIGGSPLVFTGSGGRLFGKMLLWGLLSVVTIGIFDLFVYVKYLKWEKGNTEALYRSSTYKEFAREQEKYASENVSAYGAAANNTEIARLRSGVTGGESMEAIKAMAEGGNIYACYDYACALIDRYGENNDEGIEMLRVAAYGGYHYAMLHYAYYVGEHNKQEYITLLKGAARAGNFEATRILKEYYENLAYELRRKKDSKAVDALREAAYWFKVAIGLGCYGNENKDYEYQVMLDTVAFWKTASVGPQKSGTGVVVGAVLGGLAMLAVLGVGVFAALALFKVDVPVLNMGMAKEEVEINSPSAYDEFLGEDADYGEIIGSDSAYLNYSVIGYTEADAVLSLESSGFVCQVSYTETAEYPEGTVIFCSHTEGEYPQGEIVTIDVAVAPQYPELTRARAFELVDNACVAEVFMYYYFKDCGMLDFNDVYDHDLFGEGWTVGCAAVSGVKSKADLKKALSKDFTDEYIDNVLMVMQPGSNSGITMYEGNWFEANGKIYCMPNEFMGFYSVYEETITIQELEPGKYSVRGLEGAPTLGDCDECVYTVVYVDGEYKIDY